MSLPGSIALGAKLRRGRRIELIEQADGAFLAAEWRKGAAHPLDEPPLRLEQDRFADPMSARMRTLLARSRVDVMLAPSRFVIRTLELPRGASQFLEGVVRSQTRSPDALERERRRLRLQLACRRRPRSNRYRSRGHSERADRSDRAGARCCSGGPYPHVDDRWGRRRARHSGLRSAIGRRRRRLPVAPRPYHRPRPLGPRVRDEFRRLGSHRRRRRNALR